MKIPHGQLNSKLVELEIVEISQLHFTYLKWRVRASDSFPHRLKNSPSLMRVTITTSTMPNIKGSRKFFAVHFSTLLLLLCLAGKLRARRTPRHLASFYCYHSRWSFLHHLRWSRLLGRKISSSASNFSRREIHTKILLLKSLLRAENGCKINFIPFASAHLSTMPFRHQRNRNRLFRQFASHTWSRPQSAMKF